MQFNMKVQRVIKNLTQEQLANKAGVSRSLVTKIELGQMTPTVATAKKLANVLGVDWRVFFDD